MTTTTACVPVSWLRLERYALGELDANERAAIAGHLATCPSCRACAERIESDAARTLAPLPQRARQRRARPWVPAVFATATAAAVLLFVVIRPGGDAPPDVSSGVADSRFAGPRTIAVKGGDVTLELVRERDGSSAWEPTSFAAGDRFKMLLTCPPPLQLHADLVVLQADGAAFPGAPVRIACGNRVPLPTAFRITGPGPARVCVAVDFATPPARSELALGKSPGQVCLQLEPAP